jgi:protein gp37
MADNTKIEWADATWNPITGCSVLSPGCTNCYAMKLSGTRMKHHPSRAGLTIETKAGPVWNGEVRFNEQWLTQPLRWTKPRMIFVCAHADLFHESVPDEWIDRVFAVMALAPQHIFQVLTKRSARMRKYLARESFLSRIGNSSRVEPLQLKGEWFPNERAIRQILGSTFPLPNVLLGDRVEDQKRADERIPDLLATPAAKPRLT